MTNTQTAGESSAVFVACIAYNSLWEVHIMETSMCTAVPETRGNMIHPMRPTSFVKQRKAWAQSLIINPWLLLSRSPNSGKDNPDRSRQGFWR